MVRPPSWQEFKVGFRMLVRYPWLTLVGTIALAVAIALGAMYFEGITKVLYPRLPIPKGHRVVSIQASGSERLLHDFAIWRDDVRTIETLGAAIVFMRNLATRDGRVEPVRGAEITANAFELVGTAPFLGRPLTVQDEQPAEPPVVVISHALWKARFASDPGVVGQTVTLGRTAPVIVGVMPEGFAFPEAEHIWAPLRVEGSLFAPRTGPALTMFGRLAPGVSIGQAQAELETIAAHMATDDPRTHQDLKPFVMPYGRPFPPGREALLVTGVLYGVNVAFLLLLAVVCTNVATLVFARTATRGWEIAVRTALGASRGRIVTQLFAEALVLAGMAAVIGLLIARVSLRFAIDMVAQGEQLPFWIDDGLSWTTAVYAALLTLVGAAIVGVLPALRVTKINVQDVLRSEGAARSTLRFGGFWTAVIVMQVAITVAFLPIAAGGGFQADRFRQRAEGIRAGRYMTASVGIDHEDHGMDAEAFAVRARQSFDELERRLSADPGVEGVAFADRLPVMDQFKYRIEVDLSTGAQETGLRSSTLVQVSSGFFAAFDTSVVAGRGFTPLDFTTGDVMIVNESFARDVLAGRNPIGQRIRIVSGEIDALAGETWYEVVGMVKDFGWQLPEPREQAAMYRPRLPTAGSGMSLVARVRDPDGFAARLRTVAAGVDPAIRLTDLQPLADVGGGEARINWALTWIAWLISFVVLMLSATGIHALMSFTVVRRTREIGIRVALGASPGRIVAGIFSRAFIQIGTGILVGTGLAALLGLGTQQVLLLLAADAIMLVVGLAACALPLRRALSIDPTECLRAEG